ncbi:MAG: peroxiredoxin family protein [Myxococcota bacterium]
MSLRKTLSKLPTPIKLSVQERVYPKLLAEGETAPEWHLQSWDDSWHRQGRHWSVMVFYPEDGGEADREQLQQFQAHLDAFTRLGVKVYGINPGEAPSHKAFAESAGLGFPLLTDRGGSVARLFRACVQLPLKPMYLRTVYLVNPERKIRLGNRGAPSVAAIVRSVEALQQASKTKM